MVSAEWLPSRTSSAETRRSSFFISFSVLRQATQVGKASSGEEDYDDMINLQNLLVDKKKR